MARIHAIPAIPEFLSRTIYERLMRALSIMDETLDSICHNVRGKYILFALVVVKISCILHWYYFLITKTNWDNHDPSLSLRFASLCNIWSGNSLMTIKLSSPVRKNERIKCIITIMIRITDVSVVLNRGIDQVCIDMYDSRGKKYTSKQAMRLRKLEIKWWNIKMVDLIATFGSDSPLCILISYDWYRQQTPFEFMWKSYVGDVTSSWHVCTKVFDVFKCKIGPSSATINTDQSSASLAIDFAMVVYYCRVRQGNLMVFSLQLCD